MVVEELERVRAELEQQRDQLTAEEERLNVPARPWREA